MTRKSVDPNMDLMKTKSAQPGPGGKNSATGGRNSADVNPAMDLIKLLLLNLDLVEKLHHLVEDPKMLILKWI